MRKITLTITALVTEEGFMDEIDSILDNGLTIENETVIESKDTYKLTNAIDNKFAEIVKTNIKVETLKVE